MMIDEKRIPFDLREMTKKNQTSFEIEDFSFSEDEKRYIPYFHDLFETRIFVDVLNAGNLITLTLTIDGKCHLVDSHDGSIVEYELDDNVDVLLGSEKEEENDLFPDEDGIYDLRGSILALFYDAIPKNYSNVPLTRIEKDNYVILSQEEYEKEHQKASSSPFDVLDSDDYQD